MDLLQYPNTPGFKEKTTSADAAESMKPTAGTLRGKVLDCLAIASGTADEIAARLEASPLAIRPRFTELQRMGKIYDTGQRRKNDSGRSAKVWAIA